jgi:hypothetical protein
MTMARFRTDYSRGFLDGSSVYVSLAWLALWMLWPDPERIRAARPLDAACRVSYVRLETGDTSLYMDPTVFGQRSAVGFQADASQETMPAPRWTSSPDSMAPRYLDVTVGGTGTATLTRWPLAPEAADPAAACAPLWNASRTFQPRAAAPPRVKIEASPALQGRGFSADQVRLEDVAAGDRPWQIDVTIRFAEDGSVADVFLEEGEADERLSRAVVRALYRARLAGGEAGTSGRVSVSYGSD